MANICACVQIARLAMLSLAAVFKDILPGYRIRALSDAELAVKVTKTVQKVRDYEEALLKAFLAYVKLLRAVAADTTAHANHVRCAPPRTSHTNSRAHNSRAHTRQP